MEIKDIQRKITKFEETKWRRMNMLYEYYTGRHKILTASKPDGKPNNRLVTNFAKNIVANTTGYFMGQPVTYKCEDKALAEKIREIVEYNDDAFVNTRIAEQLSIYGVGAELLYIDTSDDAVQTRYTAINPMQLVFETTGDANDEITLAIRWYDVFDDYDVRTRHIEVYDASEVAYYVQTDRTGRIEPEIPEGKHGEFERHYWNAVPVNVYYNNDYHMGDFEDVISLIDAYNTMQSESVNDYQSFADAYMLVRNMKMTDEKANQLKTQHIIEAYEDADVSYLVKQVNDSYVENIKDRIQKDIYMSSNTVNMSDDSFSGATSGAAIRRRMMNFESRIAVTERYFKRGLQRRFELICNVLGLKSKCNYLDIKPVFTRNIPADLQEIATEVTQLEGMVSHKTLLSQIPFVDDVDEELKRISDEREEDTQYDIADFGRDDSDSDDDDIDNGEE